MYSLYEIAALAHVTQSLVAVQPRPVTELQMDLLGAIRRSPPWLALPAWRPGCRTGAEDATTKTVRQQWMKRRNRRSRLLRAALLDKPCFAAEDQHFRDLCSSPYQFDFPPSQSPEDFIDALSVAVLLGSNDCCSFRSASSTHPASCFVA